MLFKTHSPLPVSAYPRPITPPTSLGLSEGPLPLTSLGLSEGPLPLTSLGLSEGPFTSYLPRLVRGIQKDSR
ncbi:Uncharacterised protein [Legionella hackeliae]|nr:hypothetical protein Lhac_2881 [Legionella hackeliae]STX46740.1 Uncharacterised protein [Legionella hackeliae]STX49938.1 Uncharacterised protein [Legionella hackeliae]